MKKTGCLTGILGTVVVIVATVVLSVLTSIFAGLVFGARFEGEVACAVLKLSIYSFVVYFVLCEVIFFTWQAGRIKREENNGDEQSNAKFKKITRIIYAACLCAMLLFSVLNVNTYTEYRNDSISEKFFVTTKEYKWKNVLRYSLTCSSEGEIKFNITMKDGKSFELIQTVTSCSEEFLEEHQDMLAYAAYLANEFDAQDNFIEKRISGKDYMRELYKDDYPDVWKYLVEIADEQLAEDNGSGENESATTGEEESVGENSTESATEENSTK